MIFLNLFHAIPDENLPKYQTKSDLNATLSLPKQNLALNDINLSQSKELDLASKPHSQDENLSQNSDLNSSKDMQNYKILNSKITSLTYENNQARQSFENALAQIEQKEARIAQLEAEISAIKSENQNLKNESENLKSSLKQRDENSSLKLSDTAGKKQILSLLQENEQLVSENEKLKKIIQLNFKSEVPKKLVFISSVRCEDMSVGSVKLTSDCKSRVGRFLQLYSSNYIFEITPIVSRANSIIALKNTDKISKTDLEKIDRYINSGIGKERASIAGGLIKEEFGEFARISYSNDVLTTPDKQGFIIKAYR